MTVSRSLVVASIASAALILLSTWLLPSFATIDVSAQTAVINFETPDDVILKETDIGVVDAMICKFTNDASAGVSQDLCALSGRALFKQSYTGAIVLDGSMRVNIEQTAIGLELTATPLGKGDTVRVNGAEVPGGVAVIQKKATPQRTLISFGTLVNSVTIGQSGIKQGRPAALLESGTLRALAFADGHAAVVSGPAFALALGDIVKLATTNGRGSLYARSDGSGLISVSGRYPATSATITRYGGSDISVRFSWWERIKQDPLLVAIWIFIGFWFAVFNMTQKIQEALQTRKGGGECSY
jgi:hypothetical protein